VLPLHAPPLISVPIGYPRHLRPILTSHLDEYAIPFLHVHVPLGKSQLCGVVSESSKWRLHLRLGALK